MIKVVIENLRPSTPHRFIFICQQEHVSRWGLEKKLKLWAPECEIVQIDGVTEGAACTVLSAENKLGTGPLMIANSDQYVTSSIDQYLDFSDSFDGLIMTMTATDPKWSFISFGNDGLVDTVVEKRVISNEATVGIYNFSRAQDFVDGAKEMIRSNKRVNGEFYVAPVYNELIKKGARIGFHNVGSDALGMFGLGTPSDLEYFLTQPIAAQLMGCSL